MKRRAAKKTSMHFAQIPVKIVKQIVDAQKPEVRKALRRATDFSNVIAEMSSDKTEPYSMPWVPPAWIR